MDPLLIVAAITMVGIIIIGGYIFYYDFTETQPKAEAQSKLIQSMTCDDVFSFPASTPLYSRENRILLNEKTETCNEAKQLEAQKEKERLNALLADPDSYESLSREYVKLKASLAESQNRYITLQNETAFIHEKITNATSRISEITEKITDNGWTLPDSDQE